MVDEPGPYHVREPMPLGPRVVQLHEFEGLAADFVRQLGGFDVGLGGAIAAIAPMAGRELDSAYNSDVAPALGGLELLDTPGDAADLASIAGVADGVLGEIATQALDLPGPDEDEPVIPANPAEPPGDPNKD